MAMTGTIIERCDLTAMEQELMPNGELLVVPASVYERFWANVPYFAYKHGLYTLPTTELISFLRDEIDGRSAIEIGSGCGIIGKALGIPCTDSMMQSDPLIRLCYASLNQVPVRYGDHVERLDAIAAVEKYRPDVVIGSWITSKFCPERNIGNVFGPDEFKILELCKLYIHIGNDLTHGWKPILGRAHRAVSLAGYVSRSSRPDLNRIYVFHGDR